MQLKKIENIQLANGLQVVCAEISDTAALELSIHVNSGSRDETKFNNGVSHLLEHMMFLGSKKYPNSLLLAESLESCGGECNAMTSAETTVYWIRSSARRHIEAIESFAEFYLNPVFSDFELEKSVVLQEMASDYDEKGKLVDIESLSMQALFENHPLSLPIIGTRDVVSALTISDLMLRRAQAYRPEHCILVLTSPYAVEKMIPLVEEHFGRVWPFVNGKSFERIDYPLPHSRGDGIILQNHADNQYNLKLQFLCQGGFGPRSVHQTFLQRILDDGIGSRLPAAFREQSGLVYDVSCDASHFADIGVFSIDVTVSVDKFDELLEKMKSELMRLKSEPPSQEEIDKIKFRYQFDLDSVLESPHRIVSRFVTNALYNSKFSIEDETRELEAINRENCFQTAQSIFAAPRRSFVLVGPRASQKRKKVEAFLKGL